MPTPIELNAHRKHQPRSAKPDRRATFLLFPVYRTRGGARTEEVFTDNLRFIGEKQDMQGSNVIFLRDRQGSEYEV